MMACCGGKLPGACKLKETIGFSSPTALGGQSICRRTNPDEDPFALGGCILTNQSSQLPLRPQPLTFLLTPGRLPVRQVLPYPVRGL
jgi:hypothetical protein